MVEDCVHYDRPTCVDQIVSLEQERFEEHLAGEAGHEAVEDDGRVVDDVLVEDEADGVGVPSVCFAAVVEEEGLEVLELGESVV